jgi:hypothetical protein
MKRTPLKPKKIYTLKRTPLKPGKNYKGLKKVSLKKSTSSIVKTVEKPKYEDLDKYINAHDWKKVRSIGLDVFAELVKLRVKYKCEICKKPGSDAHHWYYTKAHNSMTDIMPLNGICLCRKCHIKAHENFEEFKKKVLELPKYKDAALMFSVISQNSIDFDFVKALIETNKKQLDELLEELKKEPKDG